jgi:hypothetical protein
MWATAYLHHRALGPRVFGDNHKSDKSKDRFFTRRIISRRKEMYNYNIINKILSKFVIAAMVMIFILGCSGSRNLGFTDRTYNGPSIKLGEGRAYAITMVSAGGEPIAIGVRMSESALKGLPPEMPHDATGWEYVLPLPKEAIKFGYDHVGIDWNPKGHIPDGVYNTPHFDFHFYMISQLDKEKITLKGEDLARAHKVPAPEFMPEGYILPEGTEVPRMGAHAIDPSSPEFNKMPFTKTFIYGFYDGQMVFLEPMMTKAFLETSPNTVDRIKLPRTYAKNGYYPTMYSVKHDAAQREYEISLEGLIYN